GVTLAAGRAVATRSGCGRDEGVARLVDVRGCGAVATSAAGSAGAASTGGGAGAGEASGCGVASGAGSGPVTGGAEAGTVAWAGAVARVGTTTSPAREITSVRGASLGRSAADQETNARANSAAMPAGAQTRRSGRRGSGRSMSKVMRRSEPRVIVDDQAGVPQPTDSGRSGVSADPGRATGGGKAGAPTRDDASATAGGEGGAPAQDAAGATAGGKGGAPAQDAAGAAIGGKGGAPTRDAAGAANDGAATGSEGPRNADVPADEGASAAAGANGGSSRVGWVAWDRAAPPTSEPAIHDAAGRSVAADASGQAGRPSRTHRSSASRAWRAVAKRWARSFSSRRATTRRRSAGTASGSGGTGASICWR